jgi:hypothetical protein
MKRGNIASNNGETVMSRITLGFFALALLLTGITGSAYAGPFAGPNPAVESGLSTQNSGGGY